jgi:hypothetical protein
MYEKTVHPDQGSADEHNCCSYIDKEQFTILFKTVNDSIDQWRKFTQQTDVSAAKTWEI